MSIDSDLIRGHVDTIILKTLTDGDKYGYEIIKEITEKSNGSYELKQPTLYSCLKRLESQGLISAYWKNSDIGGKRHYYKLTKKGRNFYETNMNDWFTSRNIIDNLMGSKSVVVPEDEEVITDKIVEGENDEIKPNNAANQDEILENEVPNLENNLEDKSFAQLMLDDSTAITQAETTPRDFEIEDITEADEELLKGYYKTDDNQINFFASNTYEESESSKDILSEIIAHQTAEREKERNPETAQDKEAESHIGGIPREELEQSNKESSSSYFETFEGADLSLFKNNSGTNYFDKIKDDSTADINAFTSSISNQDAIFEKNEEEVEPRNKINLFGSEEDESSYFSANFNANSANINENENDDDFSYTLNSSNNDYSSTSLNFGYSSEEEDDAEIHMPSFHMESAEEDDKYKINSQEEQEINSYASSYGCENENMYEPVFQEENKPYELDILDDGDYNSMADDGFSSGISQRESISLSYSPKFTEVNDREKLDHLSSYATAPNFEMTEAGIPSPSAAIDYAELTEEFSEAGLKVKPYTKREKEPEASKNYLLVNKIKFTASWITYGIIAILLLGSYFLAKAIGYLDLSLTNASLSPIGYFIVAGAIMLVFPGIYTIIYLLNKTKKVKPNYSAVIALIFALLFFVVCINIIYTINILLGFSKFSQTDYNHLLWLLPSVCSLFIVIQSLVYSGLFKSRKFNAR